MMPVLIGVLYVTLAPMPLAAPAILLAGVALPWAVAAHPVGRCIAGFGAGVLIAVVQLAFALDHRFPAELTGTVTLEGTVVSLPEREGRRQRFLVEPTAIAAMPEDARLPRRVRLAWYDADQIVRAGEAWRWDVRLRRPRGLMNPGTFDYESWLAARRIDATGYVRGNARRIAAATGLPALRARLSERIEGEGSTRAILQALAVGDRRAFSDALWRVLRVTGTSHLVAISGLHIGLVAGLATGFVLLAVRRLPALSRRIPARLVAGSIGFALAAGYAALAGFALPTVRALVMLALVLLLWYLRRPARLGRILPGAGLMILCTNPLLAHNAGFWLSFAAVALIGWFVSGRVARIPSWRLAVRLQLAMSIGLVPLTLGFFGEASWLSFPANLVSIPLFSFLVVPLTLLAALAVQVAPEAGAMLFLMPATLVDLWLVGVEYAAAWAGSIALPSGSPSPAVLAVFAAAALAPALVGRRLPFTIALTGLAAYCLSPTEEAPLLRLTVLDVGQGGAVVVEQPGRVWLHDTGPAWGSASAAEYSLVPYLEWRGVESLERVVVSHGDRDHAGGIEAVRNAFRVEQWWVGESVERLPDAYRCRAGTRWPMTKGWAEVLWPPVHSDATGNAASCVVLIDVAGRRILLTGDIGRTQEEALVERLASAPALDVLLVSHHGSDDGSSGAFLDAARPKLAIASTGHDNAYGLPAEGTRRRLRCRGITLLGTARDGAITVTVDREGEITLSRARWRNRGLHHAPAGRSFRPIGEIHYDAAGHGTRVAGRRSETCGN